MGGMTHSAALLPCLARCNATVYSTFPDTGEGNAQHYARATLWQTAPPPDMREGVAAPCQWQGHGKRHRLLAHPGDAMAISDSPLPITMKSTRYQSRE